MTTIEEAQQFMRAVDRLPPKAKRILIRNWEALDEGRCTFDQFLAKTEAQFKRIKLRHKAKG